MQFFEMLLGDIAHLNVFFDLAGFYITFITNCSVATTKRMTKWYFKGFYFEILHQNVLMMSVWDSELANWQCEVKFVRLDWLFTQKSNH